MQFIQICKGKKMETVHFITALMETRIDIVETSFKWIVTSKSMFSLRFSTMTTNLVQNIWLFFVLVNTLIHHHLLKKSNPLSKQNSLKLTKLLVLQKQQLVDLSLHPFLSIMLNGATSLSQEHIALTNQDAINHIIHKERLKEYPWGTDFQGAQFLMQQQGFSDPYIRETVQYSDSTFVILCQFKAQSQLLFESHEIQADKTFSRTRCREFEINAFNHSTKRTATIARVFINSETEEGYYHAFNLVFKTAEADMGKRIPWGHLVIKTSSEVHIKAVLVDMHGAQVKGLGKYFAKEYNDHNAAWHVVRIVKTCRVHYERSVRRLETKGVTSG